MPDPCLVPERLPHGQREADAEEGARDARSRLRWLVGIVRQRRGWGSPGIQHGGESDEARKTLKGGEKKERGSEQGNRKPRLVSETVMLLQMGS